MSDYEANPVAVMEALALGRKVLVADTSGLSELAVEGLAAAVPVNVSPRELARALLDVASGPGPAPPDLPNWDDCAGQLLGLYEEVLSSSSRG